MRTAVATLQADQDRLVRLDPDERLVVRGGPGTGKTVVGLHRAAWLVYHDRRLTAERILVIGPSDRFLRYVSAVLPTLGEAKITQTTFDRLLGPSAPSGDEQEWLRQLDDFEAGLYGSGSIRVGAVRIRQQEVDELIDRLRQRDALDGAATVRATLRVRRSRAGTRLKAGDDGRRRRPRRQILAAVLMHVRRCAGSRSAVAALLGVETQEMVTAYRMSAEIATWLNEHAALHDLGGVVLDGIRPTGIDVGHRDDVAAADTELRSRWDNVAVIDAGDVLVAQGRRVRRRGGRDGGDVSARRSTSPHRERRMSWCSSPMRSRP
ncbi:MAG: hypothetical protein WKF58_01885 [Ilumatobacteraceae bacterium]